MLLLMIKLNLSLICLMVVSSCGYNPKKLTPSFPDTDRMTFREYKVVKTEPKVEFEFAAEYPLIEYPKSKGGLLCLPVSQALEIKRKWENRKNKNNFEDEDMLSITESEIVLDNFEKSNSEKIEQEIKTLSGVELETK